MSLGRARAIVGVESKYVPGVIERAWAMHDGMEAHPADYTAPPVALSAFRVLIENLGAAQLEVPRRTLGAGPARDEQRALLWTGMATQRTYVQALADASPARAISLILNAGLLVAASTARGRPLLALKLGKQPGTVSCEANVGLLAVLGGGTRRRLYRRFLNWEYTLDGGGTFLSAGSTPAARTVLHDLPRLTWVGVRVSLTTRAGTGPWTNVVTIATIR